MIHRLRAAGTRLVNGLLAAAACASVCHAQTAPVLSAPLAARVTVCAGCHGADGNAIVPGSPSLAAQPRLFLENQLVVIRDGLREIAVMKGLLDGVKDEEISEIAKYYAALPARPQAAPIEPAKAQRGEALAAKGLCGTCHLPDFRGREQMPRLSAQREDFLLDSMRQFRTGQTKGRDTMMSSVLYGLSDADLGDLAHFLATRP